MIRLVRFQIKKLQAMSKSGHAQWNNDKRVFGTIFKAERIQELKEGVDTRLVNSKEKLTTFVWQYCGEGTYDVCIYQRRKGKRLPVSVTAIRMKLMQKDKLGTGFTCVEFDTHGTKTRFGRRFGIWRRIVGWKDEE